MKIVVCGYGFVGSAHALSLGASHDVCIWDPAKGYNDPSAFQDADGVIIAVATPEEYETGECDMSSVYDCIERIEPSTPVLIKSTISIEGWRLIRSAYPDEKVTFSPEYLRADHAMEDFKNQTSVWIGGGDTLFWYQLLNASLGVETMVAEAEELILTKYVRNSFLALKVAFFNQVYDLCQVTKVDYEDVRALVSLDSRIGVSHMAVTDDRGFGGHCFPKDTSALLATGHKLGVDLSILSEAMHYNERLKK